MTNEALSEFLVLSRGQWDADLPPETVQGAIDRFYDWHAQAVAAGRMKPGQRLAKPARLVTRQGIVDGPFAEAKEIIGGYWFILARDLEAAARIAAENPCLACGLQYEIRQVDVTKASAFVAAAETPD